MQPQQSQIYKTSTGLASAMAQYVRMGLRDGVITPQVIAATAALLLPDDTGSPIAPAAHHALWLRLIANPDIDKLLIIAPPGVGKTSWIIGGYLSTYLGFNPNHNIIIASTTDDVAGKRSLYLRNIIENTIWQSLYPNIVRDTTRKWEHQEWSVASQQTHSDLHPTMRAYGAGSSITGSRADLIIGDDILDFENSRTAGQRSKMQDWFHTTLLSRLKRGGKIVMIGTSWQSDDLYNTLRKGDNDWVVCHTPMLSDAQDGFYADVRYPTGFAGTMLGDKGGDNAGA